MTDQKYSFLDIHFARFLSKRSGLKGEEAEAFRKLVQDVSRSLSGGHSCLPVGGDDVTLLEASACVSEQGLSPLVLWKNKLYLHKYFQYESELATSLAKLSTVKKELHGEEAMLEKCFAGNAEEGEVDWQKKAAETALRYDLCIISGGPGTGKTSTVVRIIALLLQCLGVHLSIALTAPTGKAAIRLRTSIGDSLSTLPFSPDIIEKIPMEAMTLHRLLGVRKDSPFFKHNRENPLSWDVVVVDEASMVDLALMSKLVDGLKPGGKLILLGDKDQLTSVESGAVLGDVIESLPENTVQLKKSYRFNSGIKRLAEQVNCGDGVGVWQLLNGDSHENVSLLQESKDLYIGSQYEEYLQKATRPKEFDVKDIFATFNRFRVLCGVRRGRNGVEGINSKVEEYFSDIGYNCLLEKWYQGRPVFVTRNDYSLGLYNGDIGICLIDPVDHILKVWFEQTDGSFRKYLPFRLPQCETAYAMTIHKSQGSEFERVLVVLPGEDNLVLSRELLYTAVTRAKKEVRLATDRDVLFLALHRKVRRFSGLAERIAENRKSHVEPK